MLKRKEVVGGRRLIPHRRPWGKRCIRGRGLDRLSCVEGGENLREERREQREGRREGGKVSFGPLRFDELCRFFAPKSEPNSP